MYFVFCSWVILLISFLLAVVADEKAEVLSRSLFALDWDSISDF